MPFLKDAPSDPSSLTLKSLQVLHQFLTYAAPDAAALLPLSGGEAQQQVPISDWNLLYTTTSSPAKGNTFSPSLNVRSHPDPNRHLYSVQSTIPGVTARQFWSLMASAENRRLWDSTVEEGGVKRWIGEQLDSYSDPRIKGLACDLAARVEVLRFCGIFMVAKPRDMVLLSVDASLPPLTGTSQLRLVSTSQSVMDPSLPPRKGYTRFHLQVGGFMVQDLGHDESASESSLDSAVLITQVSDLGEMAAWVPSSVIKMVASTLVPRSIASIAKIAKTMQVHRVLMNDDDEDEVEKRVSWSVKEKLGGVGGEWYVNRRLPTMVGTGWLGTPKEPTPEVEEAVPLSLQQEQEQEEREVFKDLVKEDEPALHKDTTILATPPPRKSSLASGLPFHSPNKPTLSISLHGLAPPTFTRTQDTPLSPGMYSDSDDMLSTTSSPAPIKFKKKVDLSFSDDDTETVPGSVAASEYEEGDYLSKGLYGLTSTNFRRATLHLANSQEPQSPTQTRFKLLSSNAQHQGLKEQDARLPRMSLAIVAEMERRKQQTGSTRSNLQPKEDIIDMLAQALSESLHDETPLLQSASNASALLLQGSDAMAMTLAPGARESLALGFDANSTPSGLEFQTSHWSVHSEPFPRVNSIARSISISSTSAFVETTTAHAISTSENDRNAVERLKNISSKPTQTSYAGRLYGLLSWGAPQSPIPAMSSMGRLRSRQNYRIDQNAKLHPFPGSLGQAGGRKLPPLQQRSTLIDDEWEDV